MSVPQRETFDPMTEHKNPYIQTLLEKGYTEKECRTYPKVKEVPERLRDRFSTYEEYEEALHEFLNGMW